MFLIAGIQPKIKQLEDTPRRCPACGQLRAYRKRVDHYLSLFFIPLLKVKTGEPFLLCDHCTRSGATLSGDAGSGPAAQKDRCPACGRPIEPDYHFCPYCGGRC